MERTTRKWNLTPKEREQLVLEFMPLVKKIARGLARRSTDPVEDLIQVGSIGLLEAIDRYEIGHNTEFKTYAVHYITGHIRHYLRDRQNLLRGPRALQELSYRLSTVTANLSHQLGRDPTHAELAAVLEVSEKLIDEVRQYDSRISVYWLDQEGRKDDDDSRTLLDTLQDPRSTRDGQVDIDERLLLKEAISRLSKPQQELLEMRYFQDMTQAEVARRLGVSQMEICRRLKRAVKQLQAILTPPAPPENHL
ncbi:RNA polymerase sigma factor SigF [compost metagenome]